MKQITLICSLFIVLSAHAQTPAPPAKPAAPPKETYRADLTKPITVTVTFTIPVGFLYNYLSVEQQGGVQAIQTSDKLTGAQITQLTAVHRAVTDTLNTALIKRYNEYVQKDLAKFTADTLKKYHPQK